MKWCDGETYGKYHAVIRNEFWLSEPDVCILASAHVTAILPRKLTRDSNETDRSHEFVA
jgi:hypothetical protein